MDRFENEMIMCGIPQDKINLIKLSPIWINRFKKYTQEDVDYLIYFFPKIFITLNIPLTSGLQPATAAEFKEAKKHYVPMDLS